MFGYVKTNRDELRLREYEYYRASYCGLCRSMGKCTGQCSRMLLSYDFAFLANVRMLIAGTDVCFKRRRCLVHPFRRRRMMENNEQLAYCARASAILAYEKCRDDVADERGFRRLGARLRCLFVFGAYRRAKKALPTLCASVRSHLARLSAEEQKKQEGVDLVAAIFGDLLADVAAFGFEGNEEKLARKIGFEVGRFVYVLDALDDMEKDAKRKRYNPFLLLYGEEMPKEEKNSVRVALIAGLCDLEAAFDLLPRGKDPAAREILNNILYLGMPQALDKVLKGHKEDNK